MNRWSSIALAVGIVMLFAGSTASARARESADLPALDAATAQVANELTYVSTQAPSEPREYLAALAAMDYTVGHINAALYGWRHTIAKADLPDCSTTLDLCAEHSLEQQAGICGNAAAVFVAILRRLGIQAHLLNLYYVAPDGKPGGHTTAEALWGGSWHLLDPTWGVFFRTSTEVPSALLSWAQVARLRRPGVAMVQDRSQLWWQVSGYELHGSWGTGFNALIDPQARAVPDAN